MANEATSDEPTRLTNTIVSLFHDQVNDFEPVSWPDGSQVRLLAGADTQDDCAIFQFSGNHELVVGSDYVRGPKFRLYEMGYLDEYDLGYYLVSANVSDIAAMGARPIGLLSVVRYPPEMNDAVFGRVMTGIRDACTAYGCPNVGGDIGGAERLILSASALGVCHKDGSLLRSGAKPGDIVCLTTPTGLAGAAMAYLRSARPSQMIDEQHLPAMLASWKRPTARVNEGLILGASGMVTSCQDTSDGLKATLHSIATASGAGIAIDEHALPVPDAVTAVATHLDLDELTLVMGDSVDFELAFTVAPAAASTLAELLDFHQIGLVTDEEDVVLVRKDGTRTGLPGKAWRHAPDETGDRKA